MCILTDGKRTVSIAMVVTHSSFLQIEWSGNYFGTDEFPFLKYNSDIVYVVDNVEEYVNKARYWQTVDDDDGLSAEKSVEITDLDYGYSPITILALQSGKSKTAIYNLANKIGRLPTLAEVKSVRQGYKVKFK